MKYFFMSIEETAFIVAQFACHRFEKAKGLLIQLIVYERKKPC
jgi:hypothetical protein